MGLEELIASLEQGGEGADMDESPPVSDPEWFQVWAADDELIRGELLREARRVGRSAPMIWARGWCSAASFLAKKCGIPVTILELVRATEDA